MFESKILEIKLASLNNIFKYSVLIILLWGVFSGCKKNEIYPVIPELQFMSYSFTLDPLLPSDTLLRIFFNYRDGDGDIGLNPADTLPPFNSILGDNGIELNPYHYNLNIDYLALHNGVFEPVIIPGTLDTLRYFARLQNITPEGKHKAIRGDIDWQILPPPYPEISRTIKLRIKIYDRALHESNTIESPIIKLP